MVRAGPRVLAALVLALAAPAVAYARPVSIAAALLRTETGVEVRTSDLVVRAVEPIELHVALAALGGGPSAAAPATSAPAAATPAPTPAAATPVLASELPAASEQPAPTPTPPPTPPPLLALAGAVRVRVAPARGGKVRIGEHTFDAPVALESAAPFDVDGHRYGGALELHRDARGALLLVNRLSLETYLAGVLAGEVPSSWPEEALKAQAVASRTYALYQKVHQPRGAWHDVESTVASQVYKGLGKGDPRIRQAVEATRGEVLVFKRGLAHAFFHSCCAGRTESSREVWTGGEPYLGGVACGFDDDCPQRRWSTRVPLAVVGKKLGVRGVRQVEVTATAPSGRVRTVRLAGSSGWRKVAGARFRDALGYKAVPGRRFALRRDGDDLVITGEGAGHGVGLCQWGARGMAVAGRAYRDILGHYYPGTAVKRIY
jgi:stage II sporulation protein D